MSTIRQSLINFFSTRKTSYQLTFNEGVHAKLVLKDLARFCRANDTTFLPDARAHAVLEGRREVWLRIQKYINLSPEELLDLYGKDNINE